MHGLAACGKRLFKPTPASWLLSYPARTGLRSAPFKGGNANHLTPCLSFRQALSPNMLCRERIEIVHAGIFKFAGRPDNVSNYCTGHEFRIYLNTMLRNLISLILISQKVLHFKDTADKFVTIDDSGYKQGSLNAGFPNQIHCQFKDTLSG